MDKRAETGEIRKLQGMESAQYKMYKFVEIFWM